MSRSLFAVLDRRFGRRESLLSRRSFLSASAAAGAALLFSARGFARQPDRAGRRVVVVGGGFAGLSCAFELRAAGCDVRVLEAQSRLGGRVVTFDDFIPRRIVEGGAELIGSNHPLWVAYARKFGLSFRDVTEDESLETPIVLGGRRLDQPESARLWEEMDAAIAAATRDAAAVVEDEPWNTPDATALDARSTQQWLETQPISDLGKAGIRAQLVADNGQPLDRQSYLGNLSQIKGGGLEKYWTESEVYRCAEGNQQLARKLAGGLGDDRIERGAAVSSISLRERDCIVTTVGDRTFECDDVVLATPPSTWSKIRFEPALPDDLRPQMGLNVKYLSHVRSRFWEGGPANPTALLDGDIGWLWESTDNQAGPGAAGVTAFSGGPGAAAVMEYAKDARDARYGEAIERVFPGFRDHFISSRFMDWPRDPWTLAGYSFPAPGEITRVGPKLASGVGGRLHIAGEHACYKFVGYMEGALQSGVSVARRVAKRDAAGG